MLSRLGVAAALLCLLPQLAFGWTVAESVQLAAPCALGWLLFDISFMVAFAIKVRRQEEE